MNDAAYMKIALKEAAKGKGFTSPNPMVGAVVVKHHQIVGMGFHEYPGGPHAEVNAINDAGENAEGATIYVTLEPCNHTGRTPPCTEKILSAGIAKVVVAANDPNPDVTGGGNAYLRSKGIPVVQGVCEAEAVKLNEVFNKYAQSKKPFVILKCAATLDGQIATKTGDARWISNEQSRKYVHHLRHAADAIMVGMGTVKSDNPRLTTRLPEGIYGKKARNPLRVILDSRLSISEDATVLRINSDSDTVIVTGPLPDDPGIQSKKNRLEKLGIKVISEELKSHRIDLNALMATLGQMGVTSLLVEGGSQVHAAALADGIADKILFFYAPKLLGANDGVPICAGTGPKLMMDSIPVKNVTARQFGDDVMIEGYIQKEL